MIAMQLKQTNSFIISLFNATGHKGINSFKIPVYLIWD